MSRGAERRFEAVSFDLDESCFGFLLRDEHGLVHTYERTRGGSTRTLAPCFSRLEHAQLFAAQWPERPLVSRGPSYDLAALRDAAAGDAREPDAAMDAWMLVLDVLDAVGAGDDLDAPEHLPDTAQLREGLARFVRAVDQLDRDG